jgi:hypothetical protein
MIITRKIEQYLDGTLDDKEKTLFKILVDNHVKLAEMIRLHKEVNDSIKDNELHILRGRLKLVSESYFKSRSPAGFLRNHLIFRQRHKYLCH